MKNAQSEGGSFYSTKRPFNNPTLLGRLVLLRGWNRATKQAYFVRRNIGPFAGQGR